MSQNGYMFKPNDWRNVEITEYIKVNKLGSGTDNGGKHIELQARGGLHSDSIACEGTSYHFNVYQDNGSRQDRGHKWVIESRLDWHKDGCSRYF